MIRPFPRSAGTAAWSEYDYVIASIHTATAASRIARPSPADTGTWSLVDEAHHLRNRNTQ